MTKLSRYLVRVVVFLVVVIGIAGLLYATLLRAFLSNPYLNTLIIVVLLTGIVWNIRVILRLYPEMRWLESLAQTRISLTQERPPKILSPLARLLSNRSASGQVDLSLNARQAVLDSLSGRLEEGREISRYLASLLIFLGLLGTFYGLLLTVNAIAGVISSMSVGSDNLDVMFTHLKMGLAQPLRGMATAFSGSMFGLAGALIVGFLDLTAGQAQNAFFDHIETWLSSLPKLGFGQRYQDADDTGPAYLHALIAQTSENLDKMQRTLALQEENRIAQAQNVQGTLDALEHFRHAISAQEALLTRIANGQSYIAQLLQHMREDQSASADKSVAHLLDQLIALTSRQGEEARVRRERASEDIRNDLRILARTVANLGHFSPDRGDA